MIFKEVKDCMRQCRYGRHMPRQAARLAGAFPHLPFSERSELVELGVKLRVPEEMVQRARMIANQNSTGACSILKAVRDVFGPYIDVDALLERCGWWQTNLQHV